MVIFVLFFCNFFTSSKDKLFLSSSSNFSFSYPYSSVVSKINEGKTETVIIKNNGLEAQIYSTPFDENISLTPERIKKDVPNIRMDDVVVDSVGNGNATSSVVWFTTDNGLGLVTREGWFVHGYVLFQISAGPSSVSLEKSIIDSFLFTSNW